MHDRHMDAFVIVKNIQQGIQIIDSVVKPEPGLPQIFRIIFLSATLSIKLLYPLIKGKILIKSASKSGVLSYSLSDLFPATFKIDLTNESASFSIAPLIFAD